MRDLIRQREPEVPGCWEAKQLPCTCSPPRGRIWKCWSELNQEEHDSWGSQKVKSQTLMVEFRIAILLCLCNSTTLTWHVGTVWLHSWIKRIDSSEFPFAQPSSQAQMTEAESNFGHTQSFFIGETLRAQMFSGSPSLWLKRHRIFFCFSFALSLKPNEGSNQGASRVCRLHTAQPWGHHSQRPQWDSMALVIMLWWSSCSLKLYLFPL